jgi:ribosome-associated protein
MSLALMRKKKYSSEDITVAVEKLLNKFKLENVTKIPLAQKSLFFDQAYIATGRSSLQIKSIAKQICDLLKTKYSIPTVMEGYIRGEWILIDCGPVQVNLFLEEARVRYNLEEFWGYQIQQS